MTKTFKPTNIAFIVRADKANEFLTRKTHTATDAINRIENRRKLGLAMAKSNK